jgi:uncharacterized repeat protein (TIGR01451 family)
VLSDFSRSVSYASIKWLRVVAMLCLSASSTCVFADTPSPLMVTMLPEIRVIERRGKDEQVRYVPAKDVEQGQQIYYTVRIVNAGNEKVRRAVVIQPVPANTRLVDRSVTGAGATLSYSIDGGKTFLSNAELRSMNPNTSQKITHIRWQFRHPLAPQVTVLARFRVVFD